MPTLDENTTVAQCEAEIKNTSSYRSQNSVAVALRYVEAQQFWLDNFSFDEGWNAQTKLRMDASNKLRQQRIDEANAWIAAQPSTSPSTQYAGYQLIDISGGR